MPYPVMPRAAALVFILVAANACGQAAVQPGPASDETQAPVAAAQALPPEAAPPHSVYMLDPAEPQHPYDNGFELSRGSDAHALYTDGTLLDPVSFDAVIGAEGAKQALQELVATLHAEPGDNLLGVRPPKGILLAGSPGVGKTLLARATATAVGVNFFITSGATISARGNQRDPVEDLQRLFEMARQAAPAIVFIDELDVLKFDYALSKQLGVELDGFVANAQVYVIAAVNSLDNLDNALLRAGRFDRVIHVPLPDTDARAKLLRHTSRNSPQADDVDFAKLAALTEGMNGADLVNLANVAALRAQQQRAATVSARDWDEALDDIEIGPKNPTYGMSRDKAWRTAVHEAGHATVATLISDAISVHKASVIARGPAAGYVMMMPPAQSQDIDARYYADRMAVALAGRAAEVMEFGHSGPGASADMQGVTAYARKMVTEWGMGPKIGPMDLSALGMNFRDSEHIKAMVDEDIHTLVHLAYARAETILRDNARGVRRLATRLLERQTLTGDEIEIILVGDPDQEIEHMP